MTLSVNLFVLMFSATLVAVASGLVSSFLVLRKMTLVSDALSHVALPGIALALILKLEPLIGGFLFLILGILFIWGLEFKTKLAVESLTGVIFTTALAIGSLMVPTTELLEAFFGDISRVALFHVVLQSFLALIVIAFALFYLKKIVLFAIAPELAMSIKLGGGRLELLLLLLIALTISIGMGFVGVLLMSSLLIIPAVAARQLTKSFNKFVLISVIFAIIGLIGGLSLSFIFKIPPGISVVLLSAAIFVVSLFFGKK